jgi:hypothetical protein
LGKDIDGKLVEMDETFKITAIGDEAADGVVLGEAWYRLDERWATEEELRAEQLRGCVRVRLKMYSIKGPSNTVKGENIELDFNESDGDTWIRRGRDRAWEEWINLRQLIEITRRNTIVVGYRMDGNVKKIKIGTSAFKDLLGQVENKCLEWGRSIYIWSTNSTVIMDSLQQEEDMSKPSEDEQFEVKGVLVYGITIEMMERLTEEDLALMIADIAKTGIRGVSTKYQELKRGIKDLSRSLSLVNMGLYGIKNEKRGILVELNRKGRTS